MVRSEDTLEIFDDDNLVFSSKGRWLHPLFEAEEFLRDYEMKGSLRAEDKVSGTAAALLTVRLGIAKVHSHLLSEGALEVFRLYNVTCTYETLVSRIECMTERLLTPSTSLEEAYAILLERARR